MCGEIHICFWPQMHWELWPLGPQADHLTLYPLPAHITLSPLPAHLTLFPGYNRVMLYPAEAVQFCPINLVSSMMSFVFSSESEHESASQQPANWQGAK